MDNSKNKDNKKQSKYMVYGMCFGILAGSVAMSVFAMFGQIAWGGLAVGIGLITGMIGGLILSKMR